MTSTHDLGPEPPRGRGLRALLGGPGVPLLLGVAALLRLVIGLELWSADPLTRHPLSDAAYYHRWALALAEGEAFRPGLPYWLPPLYPWLLAQLYRVSGGALAVTLVAQGLAGWLGTLLFVALAARVVGRRAGLIAGWLSLAYMPVLFFESRLLAENAAVLLALLALFALVRADEGLRAGERPLAAATLSGVLCGLAALARPNLMLAAPACALYWCLAPSRRRSAALPVVALLLGLVLGVLPALVHNHATGAGFQPVTVNGGVNFWFGNNPSARGTFHAPGPEWGSIETQRDVSLALASRSLARSVDEAEAADFWFAEGRRWIAAEPLDAARLWLLKLADTLSSTEFEVQSLPAVSRELAPLLWIPCLPFGALLFLAALGLRGAAPGRGVLGAWLAAGLAASLVYFTYSRFRLPLLPALLPFAGRGAERLLFARREVRPVAVLAGLALLAQSFVPFEGDYPRQLASNAFVDTATTFVTPVDLAAHRKPPGMEQRSAQARAALERALELRPDNPKALTELGLLVRREDPERALELFEAAVATGFDYPPAKLMLASDLLTGPSATRRDPERGIALLSGWLSARTPDHPFHGAFAVRLALALAEDPAPERRAEARRLCTEVLARDPENLVARAVLAKLGP